eukprot:9388855-Lingulodinium_polyedra.AAC.1
MDVAPKKDKGRLKAQHLAVPRLGLEEAMAASQHEFVRNGNYWQCARCCQAMGPTALGFKQWLGSSCQGLPVQWGRRSP